MENVWRKGKEEKQWQEKEKMYPEIAIAKKNGTYKWCENQRINRVRHSISKSAIFSKRARTAPATTAGKAPGRAYCVATRLESNKHPILTGKRNSLKL